MSLKSIKLAGFKSFVDPTTIPMRSYMNAIVGPNGCGKSNVVDAIRWVVGETSAKQLRGKSMADVIFSGTTQRKPVGKASVELLFDNSNGRIAGEYAQFSEIAVRREVQRDGQSDYFLNGTACRRRDIVDIFLGTGLGPRSYAIIEQGMISRLIEAKPEEFRVYLEEAAGISKYKERRRDTENRIRRTQENLDRINDICDELEKQLRHLKRQSNAAERYKAYKEEERLLQAQIKALQWQALNLRVTECDERVTQQTLLHEEHIAKQRHEETELEKFRVLHTEATDQRNEIQKHYYGKGADIARIEQRIKDTQEQTQRWKTELEETEHLWQELTESSAEHQDQIQEISETLAQLTPARAQIQQAADQAQQTLTTANEAMNVSQSQWETYQQACSETARQLEIAQTNIQHYEEQLNQLQTRLARFDEGAHLAQLESLSAEIQPLADQAAKTETQLLNTKEAMDHIGQTIVQQRQDNAAQNQRINTLRSQLQSLEGRYASLTALQESALAGDEKTNQWLARHALDQVPRLGQAIHVQNGWEHAVETVLSNDFNAVCVENAEALVQKLSDLDGGCLTLVDKQSVQHIGQPTTTRTRLAEQVLCEWPIQEWLSHVYIAETQDEALRMRSELQAEESVITRDGFWLGPNWLRMSKAQDDEAGVLSREKALADLQKAIDDKQTEISEQVTFLEQGEQYLAEQEHARDQQQEQYQSLSAELTRVRSECSAKTSRLQALEQQQTQQLKEKEACETQRDTLQHALEKAKHQLVQAITAQESLHEERETRFTERNQCREALDVARATAQREQQKADEFDIRVASNESQLALLKQTVQRAERQMAQLRERRDTLQHQLADTDSPLDALNSELQAHLSERLDIETSLHQAEATLDAHHQAIRRAESLRNELEKTLTHIRDVLQTLQMERQEITIRQKTLEEQLSEMDLQMEAVIQVLPEKSDLREWEARAEQLGQRISRLGPINLAAIEEFQSVNERKTYLDQQKGDLSEALEVLKSAIHKIDKETRNKFRETYEKVNQGFQELFPRIFGGGKATLELEEENDLLTTGVIVRAQPPGKRNTTIHLLSGGEKALTAISLVFAMFRLNPAPFCVLDEVDAPLDDINVGRFCQLVKEMSDVTQFIVISHNKVTIETADHLMGVTMQEAGVSRIVSVDIEEAISMAEA